MGTLQWGVSGTISGLQNNQQGNSIAAALATASQGGTAPTPSSTGLPATSGVLWHDTSANQLRIRDQADSTWMSIAAVDETNKQVVMQHGGCRFQFGSATSVVLKPYNGNGIKINGVYYAISVNGVISANTSTFVSGVSNSNLAASTAYLVYLFNNGGAPALDFWPLSGGHVTDSSAGNIGVEVRSNSGSPDSTRTLVGAVLTNASGQFQDSSSIQGVASWFSRKRRSVTSGNFSATISSSAATILAGSAVTAFAWADGLEIDAAFAGFATVSSGSPGGAASIGLNGVAQFGGTAGALVASTAQTNLSFAQPILPSAEGFGVVQTIGQVGTSSATFGGATFAISTI